MSIAHFSNIEKEIKNLIASSSSAISVCVAWFTNKDLLADLTTKAKSGCKVEIIISDDKANSLERPTDFVNSGGFIQILRTNSGRFLHEKFAIFDSSILIIGSYNWTRKAEHGNHESIIITKDFGLIQQYNFRFKILQQIVSNYSEDNLTHIENPKFLLEQEVLKTLEAELGNEFIRNTMESKKIGVTISADFILRYFERHGAIGGVNNLLFDDSSIQSGLMKLFERSRLDLSFEATILKPKYAILFSEKVLNFARSRLSKLGYFVN